MDNSSPLFFSLMPKTVGVRYQWEELLDRANRKTQPLGQIHQFKKKQPKPCN